jgi:hypothetical protein
MPRPKWLSPEGDWASDSESEASFHTCASDSDSEGDGSKDQWVVVTKKILVITDSQFRGYETQLQDISENVEVIAISGAKLSCLPNLIQDAIAPGFATLFLVAIGGNDVLERKNRTLPPQDLSDPQSRLHADSVQQWLIWPTISTVE